MSAPQTDVEKQKKRHNGPRFGIIAVVVFAVILLLGLLLVTADTADAPEGADAQVDGRTGEMATESN